MLTSVLQCCLVCPETSKCEVTSASVYTVWCCRSLIGAMGDASPIADGEEGTIRPCEMGESQGPVGAHEL